MEDSRIVELYWERSEEAIAESAEKYGGYCQGIAYGILRNLHDAEECVSDTWLRAWNAIPPQRPRKLAAFLGKITRNLSLDRYRKNTAKSRGGNQVQAALEELEKFLPAGESPEQELEEAELVQSLEAFLHGLSQEKRQVFLLRYWYFRPVQEIAWQLQMSESKVSSILFRARKELRQHLEKEGITL